MSSNAPWYDRTDPLTGSPTGSCRGLSITINHYLLSPDMPGDSRPDSKEETLRLALWYANCGWHNGRIRWKQLRSRAEYSLRRVYGISDGKKTSALIRQILVTAKRIAGHPANADILVDLAEFPDVQMQALRRRFSSHSFRYLRSGSFTGSAR